MYQTSRLQSLLLPVRARLPALTSRRSSDCLYKVPSDIKHRSVPTPIYGGRQTITMLPGDGIGPEMCTHVRDIFHTAKAPIDFELIEEFGEKLVEQSVLSLHRNKVGIKGNLKNVLDTNCHVVPNQMIRTFLDLYVVVIHWKGYPGLKAKVPNLNLILIRQNTEGEYSMLEHESVHGMVESLKITTRQNIQRLANFAFRYAQAHKRAKITVVHNTLELKLSENMFLEIVQGVSQSYPDIALKDVNIRTCVAKLVQNPHVYDVLLVPNLYGAVISNTICGLSGGTGLYSATNYGENSVMIFETATRQTALKLKGTNQANPIAMIRASIDMLRYLGKHSHAQIIRDAVEYVLIDKQLKTPDLGGTSTTSEIVASIREFVDKNLQKYRIF